VVTASKDNTAPSGMLMTAKPSATAMKHDGAVNYAAVLVRMEKGGDRLVYVPARLWDSATGKASRGADESIENNCVCAFPSGNSPEWRPPHRTDNRTALGCDDGQTER